MEAAARGDTHACAQELKLGSDINWKDSSGRDALAFAAEAGHASAVAFLIENGANVRGRALEYAAENGHAPVVEILLAAALDVDASGEVDHARLHLALAVGASESDDLAHIRP